MEGWPGCCEAQRKEGTILGRFGGLREAGGPVVPSAISRSHRKQPCWTPKPVLSLPGYRASVLVCLLQRGALEARAVPTLCLCSVSRRWGWQACRSL